LAIRGLECARSDDPRVASDRSIPMPLPHTLMARERLLVRRAFLCRAGGHVSSIGLPCQANLSTYVSNYPSIRGSLGLFEKPRNLFLVPLSQEGA
jgi:hypothetical protein